MSSPEDPLEVKINIQDSEEGGLKNDAFVQPSTEKFEFKEVKSLVNLTKENKSRTPEVFKKKLEKKDGNFTEQEFDYLITNLKRKFAKVLIQSGKLDVKHKTKSGKTPLHYAIAFKETDAVLKYLKEESSVLTENNNNDTALDRISINSLKSYFNYCIKKDNWVTTDDSEDVNYKMCFDFGFFEREDWIDILSKISDTSHLRDLLVHPFVQLYIEIKWHLFKRYFYAMLGFQTIIYAFFACFFYTGTDKFPYWCTIPIVLLNLALKAFFLFSKFEMIKLSKHISVPKFFTFKAAPAHSFAELFIVIASIVIICSGTKNPQKELSAFTFQAMSISILMTAAYHPKLSIWGIMLRKVTSKIILFMLFFSLLLLSFTLGNGLLFSSKDKFFDVFVNTTAMLISSSQIQYDNDNDSFFSKFYYFIYLVVVGIILINFLIGVSITDIEKIKQKSEINSAINIIGYFRFANRDFLPHNWFKHSRLREMREHFVQDIHMDKVDFYVNRKKNQFDSDKNKGKNLPSRISKPLLNKINDFINNDL